MTNYKVRLRRCFSLSAGVPLSATPALLPSPFGEGLGVRPCSHAEGHGLGHSFSFLFLFLALILKKFQSENQK